MKFAPLLYERLCGSSSREPLLQKRSRNCETRRRLEGRVRVPRKRCYDLFSSEPSGVVELGSVDGQIAAERSGVAAEHERGGKRPGLACDVSDVLNRDSCFLMQFASDRRLDRFARFEEAGERRVTSGRVLRLAAQQQATLMLGEHDHYRVDAGEMLR